MERPNQVQKNLKRCLLISIRSSVVGYSLRSGLDFLLKLVVWYNKKITLKQAFIKSFLGEEACRFAGLFGLYTLIWKYLDAKLRQWRQVDDKINGFISGSVAGIALFVENPERRVLFAQQMLVRGLQCCYNGLKHRNLVNFNHGDSIMFILASAQIMYGYAMQPTSIPRSFFNFMLKSAPISEDILNINRTLVRKQFNNKQLLEASKLTFDDVNVPCSILHPGNVSCTINTIQILKKVFKQILPVYLSLNLVPVIVLGFKSLIKGRPLKMLQKSIVNAVRSSLFFGIFVSTYQACCCVHRKLIQLGLIQFDHKLLYFLYGMINSLSIFIENKQRRSELALYVLPKGVDALYRVLYNRRWIVNIPNFEVLMFSIGMGCMISFYQTEHQAMSSMFFRMLNRIDGLIDGERQAKKSEKNTNH